MGQSKSQLWILKLGWNFTESLSLGGGGFFHSERGGVSPSDAEDVFCSRYGRVFKRRKSPMSASQADSGFSRRKEICPVNL